MQENLIRHPHIISPFRRFFACQPIMRITVHCTATGNSGHSLRQDCDIIPIYLKGELRWRNEEDLPPSFRSEVVVEALTGESSQAELC